MISLNSKTFFFFATVLASVPRGHAFSTPVFQEIATKQKTTPSKKEGVEIELPNFDELFGRIQEASPLARHLIGQCDEGPRGFAAVDDSGPIDQKWKRVETRRGKSLFQIDKIDNFQGLPAPVLRFRASLEGPCVGERFASFIMDLEQRKRWDPQIEQVYEAYPIYDLDAANIAMGFGKYGDCKMMGVGYCQTKANLGVTAREQLIICGLQDFPDGSSFIWGTEMEEWHNHLLPPGQRHTRAKSHLFSTAIVPTGDNTFDVEYVLQLEIGGKIPQWITTPLVVETCKNMFRVVEKYFGEGEGGELDLFLKAQGTQDSLADRHSILMTP